MALNTIVLALSITASIVSIGTFIYVFGWKVGKWQTTLDNLERGGCDRLQNIDKNVTKLETQMSPFWGIVETTIAQSLHHTDTPEYDALLLKFHEQMSYDELKRLNALLEADLQHTTNNQDRARILAIALVKSRVVARMEAIGLCLETR